MPLKTVPAGPPIELGGKSRQIIKDRMARQQVDKTSIDEDEAQLETERHLRPLAPNTQRGHNRELLWFRAYCDEKREGLADELLSEQGARALTKQELKGYVKFRARLIEGKVAVTGAVSTVQNCFRTFASAYYRLTGNYLDKTWRLETEAFIKGKLQQELNLTTKGLPKITASPADFRNLLQQIYSDNAAWRTPRQRAQFHSLLQLLVYGCGRVGELAVAYEYAYLNDSLKYKDLECFLYLDDSNEVRVGIIATFRLLKGMRKDESKTKQLYAYEEYDDNLIADPVVPLLALMFEDKAFKYVRSYEELKSVDPDAIRAAGNRLVVELDEAAAERCVYRAQEFYEGEWRTSDVVAWSWQEANDILQKLAKLAGYYDRCTFYTLRRMDVNELDSAKVSPGALKNAVGHVPGSMMYLNRYISTLMSCDMQSIAQKRNSDPAKLQPAQGMRRQAGLPTSLTYASMRAISRIPAIAQLSKRMKELRESVQNAFGTIAAATAANSPQAREYIAVSTKYYHSFDKEAETALKKEQHEALSLFRRNAFDHSGQSSSSGSSNPDRVSGESTGDIGNVSDSVRNDGSSQSNPQEHGDNDLGQDSIEYSDPTPVASSASSASSPNSSRSPDEEAATILDTLGDTGLDEFIAEALALAQKSQVGVVSPPSAGITDEQIDPSLLDHSPAEGSHDGLPALTSNSSEEQGEQEGVASAFDSTSGSQKLMAAIERYCYDARPNISIGCAARALVQTLCGETVERGMRMDRADVIRQLMSPEFMPQAAKYPRPGECPTPEGKCPIASCGMKLRDDANKDRPHIHGCCRLELALGLQQTFSQHVDLQRCPLVGCERGDFSDAKQLQAHVLSHTNRWGKTADLLHCKFRQPDGQRCGATDISSPLTYKRHLESRHGLLLWGMTKTYLDAVKYCEWCQIWVVGRAGLESHAQEHLQKDLQTIAKDPLSCHTETTRRSDVSTARILKSHCPGCLFDETLPVEDRWFAFGHDPTKRAQHIIEKHIFLLDHTRTDHTCFFPDCEGSLSQNQLLCHLRDFHGIRVQRKRQARDSEAADDEIDPDSLVRNLARNASADNTDTSGSTKRARVMHEKKARDLQPGVTVEVTDFSYQGLFDKCKEVGLSPWGEGRKATRTELARRLGVEIPPEQKGRARKSKGASAAPTVTTASTVTVDKDVDDAASDEDNDAVGYSGAPTSP